MPTSQSQPDESGAQRVETQIPKTRKALSLVKRELSESDLKNPGVQKMLMDDLERAEDEISELKTYRDKFYTADRDLAVTKEKLKTRWSIELITTGCIALGAAVLANLPEAWKHQPYGWLVLVIGGTLTVVGILAKAIRL